MNSKNPTLIILAGGKSSRMGKPKGLLSFKGDYWLLHQIEAYKAGESVIIGLGFDYQLYFNAIPWLKEALKSPQEYKGKKVQIVLNPTPEFGLFSTLKEVLKCIDVQTNNEILVLPIDVPFLNKSALEKIIETKNSVVIPSYHQKNGHPAKLSSKFWKSLLLIDVKHPEARLDTQIKKLQNSQISIINVADKNCIKNLNTPESWREFSCDSL